MMLIRTCILACLLALSSQAYCGSADNSYEAVQNAIRENKHLFIFVYKDMNEKTIKMERELDKAIQSFGQDASSLKIKLNDPAAKELVEKYDLQRAPMPFVLVLAPNGAITGGFPLSFTEKQLNEAISSPGMASVLKGLQDRKMVIISVQNVQATDNQKIMSGVNEFTQDSRFASATKVVVIDQTDPKEQKFLNQLGISMNGSTAITILMAPPGEIIGKYQGATSKAQILSDLQNATSGCCGPGGCCPGGKCGPKK